MNWTPKNFDEACKRAAGRRAHNARRARRREGRILKILRVLDHHTPSGRELAALFNVSEATISRDLKFIAHVRLGFDEQGYGLAPRLGYSMWSGSFKWTRGGGYCTTLEIRNGVRVK